MTSPAFTCGPRFKARVKTVDNEYQNAKESLQKIMGEILVSQFGTKQSLQQLKFL